MIASPLSAANRELPRAAFRMPSKEAEHNWFAVYTLPKNERSVVRHLDVRQIESFLPTFEKIHVWKNRQRVKVTEPLFPTYLFVRIDPKERSRVLGAPGVLRLVGNNQGALPVSDAEIEFLRSDFCRERVEPYRDLVIGQRVRIKCGPMQGVQGTLIRKKSGLRFVLTLELINQHAALEVSVDELGPVLAH
jgi:transcription antitermination factor NusG